MKSRRLPGRQLLRSSTMALTILALLTGCSPSREPCPAPPAALERIRAMCGTTPCLNARLLARLQPKEGGAQSLQVELRCRADGCLRLDLARWDVVGVSLQADADGSLTVLLPRDQVVARTAPCTPVPGMSPLAITRLLAQELSAGPLPQGAVLTTGDDLAFSDPATGLEAIITLDAATGMPAAKRLLATDHQELLRLVYGAWKRFDTVTRASSCRITTPNGPTIDLRLNRLQPATILSGSLRLEIPATARTVTLEQLGDLLAAPVESDPPRHPTP